MITGGDLRQSRLDVGYKTFTISPCSENIAEVNNCATRLRISVKDEHRVMNDAAFRQIGAHGVVRNKDAIQVIIGLSVPQVRDSMENLMKINA